MAREVRAFDVIIPANTPRTANFTADMSFPPRIVREVEVLVPPGPRGEVGFAIGAAGRAIIPEQTGQFIVTDDEVIHWPLEGYHDSGSWTFFGYNTGLFDHTITVRFLLDLVHTVGPGTAAQPIDAGVISSGGPSGGLGPPPPSPPPIQPPAPPVPPAPPPAPPPPAPPPVPLPPSPPGLGPPRRDVMPAEVVFPSNLVVSVPYDVVLGYNPALALGYVNVRNPGNSPVSGRLVYVNRDTGLPAASFDYNLAAGQGTEWQLGGAGTVGDVVLQQTSGPVTVSWKVGTR